MSRRVVEIMTHERLSRSKPRPAGIPAAPRATNAVPSPKAFSDKVFAPFADRLPLGMPAQRRVGSAPAPDFSGIDGPGRPTRVDGLPSDLRRAIEADSGFAMDDVRVHRDSPAPARLGALAFAQGRDIHLGPSQERHLSHEAWHVVQQKQGRVRPTRRVDGVSIDDSRGLEREAEIMGAPRAGRFGSKSGAATPGQTARTMDPARAKPTVGHAVAQLYPGVDPDLHEQDKKDPVIYQGNHYNINPSAGSIWNMSASFSGVVQYVVPWESATMIVGTRGEGYPHPCLIGGTDPKVSAAGEIAFYKGEPYAMNRKSGHFKPPIGSLTIAMAVISARFPDLGYDIKTGGPYFDLGTLAPSRMVELSGAARTKTRADMGEASRRSQEQQTMTFSASPTKPAEPPPGRYFG